VRKGKLQDSRDEKKPKSVIYYSQNCEAKCSTVTVKEKSDHKALSTIKPRRRQNPVKPRTPLVGSRVHRDRAKPRELKGRKKQRASYQKALISLKKKEWRDRVVSKNRGVGVEVHDQSVVVGVRSL